MHECSCVCAHMNIYTSSRTNTQYKRKCPSVYLQAFGCSIGEIIGQRWIKPLRTFIFCEQLIMLKSQRRRSLFGVLVDKIGSEEFLPLFLRSRWLFDL